jgi:ferric-dicitrate binding protein FerR (iron transport regulator)
MVVLCGGASFAAGPGGILYASGQVSVNGERAQHATSVFAGDKVQTAPGSSATVSLIGTQVAIPSETSVLMKDGMVELGCGSTSVRTQNGMGVHAGAADVVPTDKIARYAVVQTPEKLEVTSESGSVTVRTAEKSVIVNAGQSVSMPANCNLPATYANAQPMSTAPATVASQGVGGAVAVPAATGSGLGPGAIGTIAAAVAGSTATAVVVGGAAPPKSPSVP